MNRHFKTGEIKVTAKASEILSLLSFTIIMRKHLNFKYGLVKEAVKKENNNAINIGSGRVFSCYCLITGQRVWVDTHIGKTTTISLSEEN